MRLYSSSFSDGGDIPSEYTCDGADRSPSLSFSGIPSGTGSLVLICHDPDSPSGNWIHWLMYDIPPDTHSIGSGDSVGTKGKNSWGRSGYGGPCPSKGEHRYIFTLYAVGRELGFHPGADAATVEHAMHGHVLAEASVMGRYIKEENR